MHFARGPDEPADPVSLAFHTRLLAVLPHQGTFTLLTPEPAWPDNPSHESFVLFLWRDAPDTLLICVNEAPTRGQCRVRLDLGPGTRLFEDLLGPERYERDGAERLYLDLPAWGVNMFKVALPTGAKT